MTKQVAVSQGDIDSLERARLALWDIVEEMPVEQQIRFFSITESMWLITHRRYPEAISVTESTRQRLKEINEFCERVLTSMDGET